MNFVPARWIITMHQHGSVGQLAKIPRPPRMIENHLLVKLFNFRAHENKRTADAIVMLSEAKHLWLTIN